jgi:hypothetical protein
MNQRVYLNGKLKLRNVGSKKLSLKKAGKIVYRDLTKKAIETL